MLTSIAKTLVNLTLSTATGIYYKKRDAFGPIPLPPVRHDSMSSFRRVPFFRGMMHFKPSPRYLNALLSRRYDLKIFQFGEADERDLFRTWRQKTGDVLRNFLDHPEAFGERPIPCGHSEGGFPVYMLAAIAKHGKLAAIRSEFPGLDSIPLRNFERLRERLSAARFVAIDTPFHGVPLTPLGRRLNDRVIEPVVPSLFNGMEAGNLSDLYRRVGKHPNEVIDANLVREKGTPFFRDGSRSKVSNRMIRGVARVLGNLVKQGTDPNDIVPVETMMLDGVFQVHLPLGHNELVDTYEAAMALADVLDQIGGMTAKLKE